MKHIIDFIDSSKSRYVEELNDFLRIPSISTNPENKEDVERCAVYIKEHLDSIGVENATVFHTQGHPVVYGEWLRAGKEKPTILIYGHYDVQPVEPLDLWTTPPFEPIVKNGNIYARGSADDKGQTFIHFKAVEAYLKNKGKLPINIKLLIEGEEEIGSINLAGFIEKNKDLLKCDAVVISDTAMYDINHPSIGYALRGLCYMEIEVTGPNRDLHSGHFGGSVDNPINALAKIITGLKDDKGKILIDGFYDDVAPLDDEERAIFSKLPFSEKDYMEDLGVEHLFGEEGFSTIERLWVRPTLDCNGIWGGFIGEGAKTVIPSKAYAKISMRLVPNQNPHVIEKLFTDYVKKITPKTVKVSVKGLHHGKPAVTPIDSKWVKAAVVALEKAFSKKPVFIREGGSIPIVVTFEELLGAHSVLLGFGLPDENAHSPDEHLNLDNFHKGIITAAIYYNELAEV